MLRASSFGAVVVGGFLAAGIGGCSDAPETTTGGTAGATTTSTSETGGTGGSVTGSTSGTGSGVPCAGVSKGPWALHVDETSAVVRWEACEEGLSPTLRFAPEDGGAETEVTAVESPFEVTETHNAAFAPELPDDSAGTYYMFEAALTGLSAGQCYSYTIDAAPGAKGRVCAAQASGGPIRFMAIADTNPGLGDYTKNILTHALAENPDFVMHGGDIQYYASGLETWASWFPLMQPMFSQGAFFPAIGNHEAETPIEYEQYTMRFFGDAGFDGQDGYYRFSSGGVWFFVLNTELDDDLGTPMGDWLAAGLEEVSGLAGYRFSVLIFHKPWVTCGDKSQDSGTRMQFEPLFAQYHVPLVIQGHMHGYERFDLNGVTYITTGGGGGALEDINKNIDRPECAFRVASGAFRHAMVFEVGASELTGRSIDDQGNVMDEFAYPVPMAP